MPARLCTHPNPPTPLLPLQLPETLEHLALFPPSPATLPRGSVLPGLARLPCLRRLAVHWWMVDESEQGPEDWDDGDVRARLHSALPALEVGARELAPG